MDLSERRRLYVRKLEESLDKVVRTLSPMPEVERIILFGSFARGRRDLLTDLDILVVMQTELPFIERLKFLYQTLDLPVDADIICYTPEEFEALKEGPFLKKALKEGIVLYEKEPA